MTAVDLQIHGQGMSRVLVIVKISLTRPEGAFQAVAFVLAGAQREALTCLR